MSKEKQSVSGTKTAARVLLAAVFVLLTAVCVFAGAGAADEQAVNLTIAPTGYIVDPADNNKAVAGLYGAAVDKSSFNIKVVPVAGTVLAWENPDGTLITTDPTVFGFEALGGNVYTLSGVYDLGEYTVYTTVEHTRGNAITFTVYDSKRSMSLTAGADEILEGNSVSISLEAPKGDYKVTVEHGTIPPGQVGVSGNTISVGLEGIKNFVIKSDDIEDIVVTTTSTTNTSLTKSLTIRVVPGKISAEAVPAAVHIGNEIEISGINELGGQLNLYMMGSNYFKQIVASGTASDKIAVALNKTISGKEFEVTLKTGVEYLGAEVGLYTLYLAKVKEGKTISNVADFADREKCYAYTTIVIKVVADTTISAPTAVPTTAPTTDPTPTPTPTAVPTPTPTPTATPTAVPTIGINPVFDNELPLFKGWNFISVPKKLASSCDTAGELFASVDTAGTPILSFDAKTKQWTRATSSTVISPLDAYWIYTNSTYRLTPSFDTAPAVPVVKSVYTGWNAVGISAENSMTAKDAFNGVNWRTFSLWDAGNQRTGTNYNNGGSGAYSDEQFIPLYKGGWLYVNENGTVLGYA